MPDLVSALRTEIASLERQVATWKALHDHQGTPLLMVMPEGDTFRVSMVWNSEWALAEFGCLLATVVKHVANNAGLEEDQLLFAIDHALDAMQGEQVGGGKIQ